MKITVLYVGTSLLAPLRRAESEINKHNRLKLQVATYNCGAPLNADEWRAAEADIAGSEIIFVIHITEGENAARIASALKEGGTRPDTVIAFNCMPDLMRCTRMGKLEFAALMKASSEKPDAEGHNLARKLVGNLATWMSDFIKGRRQSRGDGPSKNKDQYLALIGRLPAILKFVPGAGKLRDIKNYLLLFAYFLQPTPKNIRFMLLHAIKNYARGDYRSIKVELPKSMPTVAIYHPDASNLFESFESYKKWYERDRRQLLCPERTVGLLLMRPQIISDSRKHYDGLIRAIENEGLSVIPAISTFMDNRAACGKFFVEEAGTNGDDQARGMKRGAHRGAPRHELAGKSRVSQVVSLTGFSFVGGPAMNDSKAATEFLNQLNVPFRSMVSLDVQTIEHWNQSRLGLNPIQTAMQIAIPEIDGATEPFVYGGLPSDGNQPEALKERCQRIARRLVRWNKLRVAPRADVRLALLVFCFPPNKGNIGTAADLDVFPSMWRILSQLRSEGYTVEVPDSPEQLRESLLEGNADEFGTIANVAYRMSVDEYRRLCPFVNDIEREWGRAPGTINSNGREILILGAQFGNAFVGVQPTFGYEGDPMRLLAAESGAPHHGFMALYTYIEKVLGADAVVHVGTHGALEFMPGKQVGLSEKCWPDRLMGELPNVYIYSVNNPSEGTIAKRRSYAELVSYLTPPIESAGLYKDLASLKELITAYRSTRSDAERLQIFEAIQAKAQAARLQ